MAGTVIRAVPLTFVSFTNIPSGAGTATTFWLARNIDVTGWTELTAIIREHPGTTISGSFPTKPTIQIYADGVTDEDPSVFPGFESLITTYAMGLPSAAPFIKVLAISPATGAGCSIAIAITALTGASAVADIQLSIDISGKALRAPSA